MAEELKIESLAIRLVGDCWVPFTNTDCTEGRGHQVPLSVHRIEASALRAGKGQYVMGSNAPVERLPLLMVRGLFYGPVQVHEPTADDQAAQTRIDARNAAVERAKAAGLTDEEIKALAAVAQGR